MTRDGIDALREQLYAECLRHGLGKAAEVLVVADGAMWIWNLVADRFAAATQQLDFYHASQHLWAVARAASGGCPGGASMDRTFTEETQSRPVGQSDRRTPSRYQAFASLTRATAQSELKYFETHRDRLNYHLAHKRGQPLGSGAIESTWRQYQCRVKRPGQFWTRSGDEALMCLEPSGVTNAGPCFSLTPLTHLKTEMRPSASAKLFSGCSAKSLGRQSDRYRIIIAIAATPPRGESLWKPGSAART